ncbi:predicted protein [Naegleria gruberi]|uniref:Predicted protein n=1 Tax=Naegleria gruberi TaxID=5762 RepID=D2VSI8_NAEGR|nr:uncharacterized protein NAEGRDRAFT_59103 [Naegleria gruberi]EFC40200.1 predicted protein [Naegleria gruberi]|eukprot:XP_002672944.1 predicted protein [Naegleria gruberi strain NEG-M]
MVEQTRITTTTTRTTITSPPEVVVHGKTLSTSHGSNNKLYKVIKHGGMGVFSLSLSRIALYAPFSVQKTLIAISDTPDREDEEASQSSTFQKRLSQYFERPLMNKLVLYQLGHIFFTSLMNRQTWVPLSSYKPLEHAIISASTFPLYYILLDQESRLVTKRGRSCEVIKVEDGDNTTYWQGFAIHVAHSFLVHSISLGISQMILGNDASLGNVSDEAVNNHDSSDHRAKEVLVETLGMVVGRLACLPLEIYSKQLLLKSKPKKDHYLSTYVKSAILTLPQCTTSLVEYWLYRTLNRFIQ